MHDVAPPTAPPFATDRSAAAPITRVTAHAYTIPTDAPEADGTFEWHSTTLIVTEVEAAGVTGLGYTYSDACVASLIRHSLTDVLTARTRNGSSPRRCLRRAQRDLQAGATPRSPLALH